MARARRGAAYLPESFDANGFIHCTNGFESLCNVGNMFCTADSRDYLVLALDVTKISSEVRYDHPERIYPHIYRPINAEAVIGLMDVERNADGTFIGFTER
ncbi:MAG TPA: DUF952 domain-containing protein [Thermomicrobiales bacterium]|nr:DUF952 domain-containing protein [Thermomicrobiales bacterium]